MNDNNKSPHILNTSAQLLGLCFIVLTAFRIQKLHEASFIDEMTAAAALLFMVSSILSFLSIRSNSEGEDRFERIADVIFLLGLGVMFLVIVLVTLDLIN
jgi:hypothetical protein